MTLREFIQLLSENPICTLAYALGIPLLALWLGWIAKDKGTEKPWSYLYSAIIYAVSIPAIFGIALTVYLFLFERRSIYDTNLFIQVLPLLSMFLTVWIIKWIVEIKSIEVSR